MVAGLVSTLLLFARRRMRWGVFRHPTVIVLSLLNAGGFLLQYWGLNETNSAAASILANVGVILVAILAVAWLGEKMTARLAAAVFLAFLGSVLLVTRGNLSSLAAPEVRGPLMVAVASFLWSLFVVINKDALSKNIATGEEISWAVLALSGIFLLPAAVVVDGAPTFSYSGEGWAVALYTGIFCSSLSYIIYMRGLSGLPATVASVIIVAEVLVAFVLTAVVFSYIVGGWEAVGGALVLVGIVLASLASRKGAPEGPAAEVQSPAKGPGPQ